MHNLPPYISIVFVLTTIAGLLIFFRAARYSSTVIIILSAWVILQGIISSRLFYTNTSTVPPRFALAALPPLVVIAAIFILPRGRKFVDALNLKMLTMLHIIRIPVELVLLWLFISNMIPGLMTFEGHNFDIVSGLTAPVVYWLVFVKKIAGDKILLVWNFICLALVMNIFITALLAAPLRFQQLAFDQPNIAIFYFPFIWLPACLVPMVIFAHLASIRKLISRIKTTSQTKKSMQPAS